MNRALVVLAAIGALCGMWVAFGFLLAVPKGTVMVCLTPRDAEAAVRHHGWLRELGLIRCPLILVDTEEDPWVQYSDVGCCAMDQIGKRLEQERTGFD